MVTTFFRFSIFIFCMLLASAALAQDSLPEGHPAMPPFEAEVVEMPAFNTAVIRGTLSDEVDLLFASLFAAADEQGLWTGDTEVGAIFPFAMANDWQGEIEIYAGISIEDGMQVSEPLFEYTVPGGIYLMALHHGSYESSGETWMAAFAWAAENGIEFGSGPAFEHYLDDPEEVAAEDLRCEIYIPLATGEDAEDDGEDEMGMAAGAPDFNVMVETLDSDVYFIYIEGTASDDYGKMIRKAIAICQEQELTAKDMAAGAVYPDAMANGYNENTPVYFGIALETAPDVEAPLDLIEMPQGEYLIVEHVGPYENISNTWMAAFEWAEGHGIEFSDGICGEVYMSDPDQTPDEERVAAIFIPLVPGQAHPLGHPGYVGDKPMEGSNPDVHPQEDDADDGPDDDD